MSESKKQIAINQLCLFCKLWWEFAIKEDVKLEEAVAWLPGYILNKHLRKNSKARVTTKNGLVMYNVTWSLACIHAQLKRQTIELKGLQKYQDFFRLQIHTDIYLCFFGFHALKTLAYMQLLKTVTDFICLILDCRQGCKN